jgi:hypothetical protein
MKLQQQRQVTARPGKHAEYLPESPELLQLRNTGNGITSGIAQCGQKSYLQGSQGSLDKVVNNLQYVSRRTSAVSAAREKNFNQKS